MKTEILATFTGKIIQITTGAIVAGNLLFSTEALKMEVKESSPFSGTFEAVVAVGASVVVGEVIGYFITEE